MPKVVHDLPADLKAGSLVIYHLPRNWYIGDNPHRVALVSGVYLDDNEVVQVDLTVFLQTQDGQPDEVVLPIAGAVYDPDCPRGTFCLSSDSEDELQSVGELRGDSPEPVVETSPTDTTHLGSEVVSPPAPQTMDAGMANANVPVTSNTAEVLPATSVGD